MTFWSGDTLENRLGSEGIVIPYRKELVDCAAYTLRVGYEVYITPDERLGKIEKFRKDILGAKKVVRLKENEHFIIPAGQFAWLLTLEHINVPKKALAFISIKTTYKFQGLINVSGFHVDPGFKGNLVYAVYNAGPQEIRLAQGTELFLIWFADLDHESEENHRKKGKQDRIKETFLVPGEIISLQGLNDEIKKLNSRISKITTIFSTIVAGLALLFAALRVEEIWKLVKSVF